MNLDKFVKLFVKIEYIEDEKAYGHHLMQLICIKNKEPVPYQLIELNIDQIARRVARHIHNGVEEIFLSLDFAPGEMIHNDFCVSFHIKYGKIYKSFVVEYSSTSGKIYDSYRGDGNREIEDIGDSILKRVKLIFS